jgi:hypothetical protein
MATAKKTEWLVIIPDKEGVHEKRLEVRPKHFEGIKSFEESGKFKMGGEFLILFFLLRPWRPVCIHCSTCRLGGGALLNIQRS